MTCLFKIGPGDKARAIQPSRDLSLKSIKHAYPWLPYCINSELLLAIIAISYSKTHWVFVASKSMFVLAVVIDTFGQITPATFS